MMTVTSSLIQCANSFNISYANKGIHVKSFVSAEIFPYIKESAITNTTKFIRHPLYLKMAPKGFDPFNLLALPSLSECQES